MWRDSVDRFVDELEARCGLARADRELPDLDLFGRRLPDAYRFLLEVCPDGGLPKCKEGCTEVDPKNSHVSANLLPRHSIEVLFEDPMLGGTRELDSDEFWFMGHDLWGWTVLVGGEDPVVMLPRAHRNEASYGFLVALRLSRWLDGLFLPDDLGVWPIEMWAERPDMTLSNTCSFVGDFGLVDSGAWRERFDDLLDSLVGVRLPSRGSVGVSKSLVLPDDAEVGLVGDMRIGPVSMRTRSEVLLPAMFGAAALDVSGSGFVRDGLGVFGAGIGVELSGAEAVEALLGFATAGDFDDLFLEYRQHVVQLNRIHEIWPLTRQP